MNDTILQVKRLSVSFRTPGGTLKAVRDISFDLERGRTLAIVGESGSGKSVTSKAILGILAGNSIVENGEILYDGKDLLKLPEKELHKLRGDKIAMIFQDPLSSLNPIVKIGKQITEAMLLKSRVNRREARDEFNTQLALLRQAIIDAGKPAADAQRLTHTFDNFNIEGIKLENHYNEARSRAGEVLGEIDDLRFRVKHKQSVDLALVLGSLTAKLRKIDDRYLLGKEAEKLGQVTAALTACIASCRKQKKTATGTNGELPGDVENALKETNDLLSRLLSGPVPNFFRIGYWVMKHTGDDLSNLPVEEANAKALEILDRDFMNDFIAYGKCGIAYSAKRAAEGKAAVIERLEEAKKAFSGDFTKAQAKELCRELSRAVEASIDRLKPVKDSIAYTFGGSLGSAIDKYFYYQKFNPREERRFARQTAKRERLLAGGKKADWKVVPKSVCDPELLRQNILDVMDRLEAHYKADLAAPERDLQADTIALIDHFKAKASAVVYKVTKSMAKEKAIKLMEEVGIPEPRVRFNQYPFEFSGGMRQRIVIAIALSANPDVLICDEPTTALDVTIQAQILELINNLKRERNLSVIFITHDLGVVANMADDIAVMYAGKIVEYGTADDIFYDARHPYTWALLSSMPDLDTHDKLDAIPGTPPNMIYPPEGDAFAERNKYAMQIDYEQQPPMFRVSPTHTAATWLLHPDAPKVEVPAVITDRIARMRKQLQEGESHGRETE